jgi:hypothetical protein
MAAAFMFALPGIPSIFNGQEIGASTHPYNASQIFQAGSSIQSLDQYGLVPFYATLARMKTRLAALRSPQMEEVPVTPGASVYAFRRWEGSQHVLCLMNMRSASLVPTVSLPVAAMGLDSSTTYYLSDQVTNSVLSFTGAQLASASIPIPASTTRVYVIDTRPVSAVEPLASAPLPGAFSLQQNYPNPFNPSTTITFELPARGEAHLALYDILGQEIRVLADGLMEAGRHQVVVDASALPSGVYFCRLEAGARMAVKKMLLLK